jgi:asparagine synthase (glutamine-hydrolysing)
MSAIWGIIQMKHIEVDDSLGRKMEEAMSLYRLDYCKTKKMKHVIMGYGHQDITAESKLEQLPYFDEDELVLYTADCMIDNRDELIRELGIQEKKIGDGALLYSAYHKWGEDFTDHVLGVFTFATYRKEDNICCLWVDHTGSRSLYYYIDEQTIYFSTVFSPIHAVLPKSKICFNEKWMTFCESTYSPDMMLLREETPFENIKMIEAGHSITFRRKNDKIITEKHNYWKPKRKRKMNLRSQLEYKELFVNTLQECIKDLLRSEQVGITLSSGLDSSAVACIAASLLENKQKSLYSFTSVPLKDYQGEDNPYFITDESEGVKMICEAYRNIRPEFVRCEGKNSFSELRRLVRLLEFPHKSRQNMVWLDEIYEKASQKGCRIILKGQYGNSTISYGRILTRVYDDLLHMRWRSAYREMAMFCRRHKISKKRALKAFITEIRNKIIKPYTHMESTLIKKELLDKHGVLKKINRIMRLSGGTEMDSRSQKERYMYDLTALSQLGALDTRFGLMHGLIIRDPLKDKRMIELCYNLPVKCFVQEGTERTLVRKYMQGIIPDGILNITNRRGLQGADFRSRIVEVWEEIQGDVLNAVENPRLEQYFKKKKLEQQINDIKSGEIFVSEEKIVIMLMLCSCSFFLDEFGAKCS